jgi:YVTN family beta-propeller protein
MWGILVYRFPYLKKACYFEALKLVTMKKVIPACFLLVILSINSFAQGKGTVLVANKNDNTLSFIDLKQKKEVATIPVGVGPHEVAVSPSGKIAAVANYGNKTQASRSVSVIDIAKKSTIKEINLGEYVRPHGMEFISEEELIVTSEAKKVLLRVNIQSGKVSEVAKTDQLVSHMVSYSNKDQKAYVANINSGTVSLIDVSQNNLIRQIPFKPGIEGLAVSPDGKELWVANRTENIITAINTATFETLATFPAQLIAYRVKFLPNGKYAVVSNGSSGNVSIFDVAAKKWIKDINLITESNDQPVPGGITASPDNKWVYICMTGANQMVTINTKDWTVHSKIDTGNGPDGIYYSPVNL